MKFIGLVIFVNTLGSTMAQVCKEINHGKTCLKRDQVEPWQQAHMKDGDPCFTSGSGKWCFTIKDNGLMYPCECKPECGCGSTLPPKPLGPKCDNSKVPSSFITKCGSGYGTRNTMCMYEGMGHKCKAVCNRLLTKEEKEMILKKHNDLRRKVAKGEQPGQPSATNMNELVWNDELEEVAQRWADQCQNKNDKVRSTKNFGCVGQNVAWFGTSENGADNQVEEMIQDWYDEVVYFHNGVDRYVAKGSNTKVVTLYTNVVWAKTKYVGCGFIHYKGPKYYQRLLACNYGPRGNVIGKPVYKRGQPGSDCRKNNDGLCA